MELRILKEIIEKLMNYVLSTRIILESEMCIISKDADMTISIFDN